MILITGRVMNFFLFYKEDGCQNRMKVKQRIYRNRKNLNPTVLGFLIKSKFKLSLPSMSSIFLSASLCSEIIWIVQQTFWKFISGFRDFVHAMIHSSSFGIFLHCSTRLQPQLKTFQFQVSTVPLNYLRNPRDRCPREKKITLFTKLSQRHDFTEINDSVNVDWRVTQFEVTFNVFFILGSINVINYRKHELLLNN